MNRRYEPKPGTVAFRVLAYLQTLPPGAELMTSALAESIGLPANNVSPCLEPAVDAGLLFKRQRDSHVRSPYWWSLTDHANGAPPPKRRVVYVPDAPVDEIPPGRGSQHVVKATAARPDATDRDAPADASPVGGPMGAGQPAAAGPAGVDMDAVHCKPTVKESLPVDGLRLALWSDGTLQIERQAVGGAAELVLFSVDETRQLLAYLDRLAP